MHMFIHWAGLYPNPIHCVGIAMLNRRLVALFNFCFNTSVFNVISHGPSPLMSLILLWTTMLIVLSNQTNGARFVWLPSHRSIL